MARSFRSEFRVYCWFIGALAVSQIAGAADRSPSASVPGQVDVFQMDSNYSISGFKMDRVKLHPASENRRLSPNERDQLFAKAEIAASTIGKGDQLDKDLLIDRMRYLEIAEVHERYPAISLEKLKALSRLLQSDNASSPQ